MTQAKFVFKVSYKSAINGRVARLFVKVPYGAAYGLTEVLTRAYLKGDLVWYRVEDFKPGEITDDIRDSLLRWPQALVASSAKTKVVFGA